jgi:hypothetical protein
MLSITQLISQKGSQLTFEGTYHFYVLAQTICQATNQRVAGGGQNNFLIWKCLYVSPVDLNLMPDELRLGWIASILHLSQFKG